ncbi:unnamed protein product [Prorocentrum cordatum]|uniref:Secreted protein n=1 Tax=Prorocentrum cordatum TaxID=2364126 RepID=A0ABN9WCC3_9DINO|nr:unnamed protein product [Polarella glacialis]
MTAGRMPLAVWIASWEASLKQIPLSCMFYRWRKFERIRSSSFRGAYGVGVTHSEFTHKATRQRMHLNNTAFRAVSLAKHLAPALMWSVVSGCEMEDVLVG